MTLPSPPPPLARSLAWLRAYIAHDDPAALLANIVAVAVGTNLPFYPLYMIALAGRQVSASAPLAMLAAPLFLAIPPLSRRSSRAGRLALPLVGTANTLWCLKLLGPAAGVGLFLLPCIVLAALLFRQGERGLLLLAASLPIAVHFIPDGALAPPLIALAPAAAARMTALDAASVAMLCALLALQFAALLRSLEAR